MRYLYTTDLSLSEEVEEACRVGDRGAPQGRQGPGTRGFLILNGRPKITSLKINLYY
nr:hypothetical protein [Metallosphaera yellowstonensis]